MALFKIEDLSYNGVEQGVHSWDHPNSDQPYYWHPDWLHIAEDMTGMHGKKMLTLEDGEKANQDHAKRAIIEHLNNQDQSR
ncbi:hypothetical protein VISI1226_22420 [Vibrio sinaloensis DSM 21326]|uniref:Uncharacterized protein n=1 Tax=Vibrio sinaloensis DSM 21326 TaxID=945550 RepID=E8M6Q4_PHOS4|nr:hypothetical protein [Vibrio sinaloensis]EGA70372.1 hypothetical protein VISI1226_22420 [Vibrio sinaloensis DSM 21326]